MILPLPLLALLAAAAVPSVVAAAPDRPAPEALAASRDRSARPAPGAAVRPGGSSWKPPADAEVTDLRPGVEAGQERHPDVPVCRDFRLTAAQALVFFRQARVIDRQIETHEFNWAPCLMTGRLRWADGAARWQISAFLVGEVPLAAGEQVLLGCDGPCKAAVDAAGRGAP